MENAEKCKNKECYNPPEPESKYCTECGLDEDDDELLRRDLGMEYEDDDLDVQEVNDEMDDQEGDLESGKE